MVETPLIADISMNGGRDIIIFYNFLWYWMLSGHVLSGLHGRRGRNVQVKNKHISFSIKKFFLSSSDKSESRCKTFEENITNNFVFAEV